MAATYDVMVMGSGNTIKMAIDIDALPWGDWSSCHAVARD